MRGRSRSLLPVTITRVGGTLFSAIRSASMSSQPLIPKDHIELKPGEMFSPRRAKLEIENLKKDNPRAFQLWLSLSIVPNLPLQQDMLPDIVYLKEEGFIGSGIGCDYRMTRFEELRKLFSQDLEAVPTGYLKLLNGAIFPHEEIVKAYIKILTLRYRNQNALELLFGLCFGGLSKYKESDLILLVQDDFVDATGVVKNGEYEGDYVAKATYRALLRSGAEARCPFEIIPDSKRSPKLNATETTQSHDVKTQCRRAGF